MPKEYDPNLEEKFQKLADERIMAKKFLTFDKNTRIVKREKFPELQKSGQTGNENFLVLINPSGETIIISHEVERAIYAIGKIRFEK